VLLDHCESAEIRLRAEPDVSGVFFTMRGEMAKRLVSPENPDEVAVAAKEESSVSGVVQPS
jgi:hypothetical protein